MLEIPEALTIARQVEAALLGRSVTRVVAGHSPHKFAWYYEEPSAYSEMLVGRVIAKTAAPGGKVEVIAGDAVMLFGDGVNLRYHSRGEQHPVKHQLLVEFDDGSALSGSVQMYGGLWCFPKGSFNNYYYQVAREKPTPLSPDFAPEYFRGLTAMPGVAKLSTKAFLATEQRIPGLGNGVLQDILYNAGIHPKRKMGTLTDADIENLYAAVKTTLAEMTELGGRDTEKDLLGNPGGYHTKMSSKTHGQPCSRCGSIIVKESYMGGAVYYCGLCQVQA
ncbi:MAG: Formamidopyrimidine-DNA glycosylase [Bacillota bacterium]|nr:MAG: Formamidopyrimidine-DNA glycosylase [Bacillota bacterium]MBS3949798.1 endonuclease VIII [Peptococcaceae bacterium]